ncbi:sugar O-acetyltransferase, partial [Vibrio cholerae]|nr:sugar O-acetyltransferase [Vibrio cholerae]
MLTALPESSPSGRSAAAGTRPVILRSGCRVGACATLLPTVTIGSNAVVAPGAMVARDVPANAIVEGNPARISG